MGWAVGLVGCLAGFRVYGLGLALLLRLTGRVLRAVGQGFWLLGPLGYWGWAVVAFCCVELASCFAGAVVGLLGCWAGLLG